jgi:hypothetical protein
MRRFIAILALLGLCLFCQCKRPAPAPDETRVAHTARPGQERQAP